MKKKSQIKLINIFKWLRFLRSKMVGEYPKISLKTKSGTTTTYLKSLNPKSLCCQRSHLRCLPAYGGLEMKTNTNTKIKIGTYVHVWVHSFLTPKTYYLYNWFLNKQKNSPKKIGAKKKTRMSLKSFAWGRNLEMIYAFKFEKYMQESSL